MVPHVAAMVFTAAMLLCALALTFTVSDYYIFNRLSVYGGFAAAQWIKKAGLLLLPGAVFFKNRRCADCAKYVLPVAVLAAAISFGDFFDITKTAETYAQEIYNGINLFLPKWARIALFCGESACMLAACACLFVLYGPKIESAKAVGYLALALAASLPLNIFENFFDIEDIPADSILWFNSFTIWHLCAVLFLAGLTIGAYLFLRRKPMEERRRWLCAIAGMLLLQYHSKDSVVMGDGYNVYTTVFACVPLFICNIGVYVAALAVFLNRRILHSMTFFVHAGGAISVFFYFAREGMSEYGIFCSYSCMFFVLTHSLLFALCVLPSALGMYKFRIKDCVIPLIYYFIVVIAAAVASAAVTGYSISLGLTGDDIIMPNYAFTQINPLPFEVPNILPITLWGYELNVLYLLGLYAFYVAIFFTFYGLYRLYLFLYGKILQMLQKKSGTDTPAQANSGGDMPQ